jgi:hypothetical protein
VDFAKESMTKRFPKSRQGMEEALTYCKDHKLSSVVLLSSPTAVDTIWDNPDFNK